MVPPFAALTPREPPRRRSHSTRSRLDDDAFLRGNSAAGEALLGMALLVHAELARVPIPVYPGGPTAEAYEAWANATLAPLAAYWISTIESVLTPLAQQAIATRETDVELAATQVLARAFYDFARFIRAAPLPPEWSRQPQAYAEY